MSEKRDGTGQRRMRTRNGAVSLVLNCTGIRSTMPLRKWPPSVVRNVQTHAENLERLMTDGIARTLAESGPGEPKSAPIDAWRKSSGLGKPAEQLLRTLCAMGQTSRVKKRAKGSDSPRKVWHYGFFDAASYYDRVPRSEWPTRGGVTVSRDELQRYGGAWDVAEREAVDGTDEYVREASRLYDERGAYAGSGNVDPRTLAVGIACGRYVVNEDGTISMAVSGWGATSRPVGELDCEPVAPTGEADADTGLMLLDTVHGCGTVADRADPDHARAAFAEMRGEAQYATTDAEHRAPTAVDAMRTRIAELEAERDAAIAERDRMAQQRNEWRWGIDASITGQGDSTTAGMSHEDALRISRESIAAMAAERDRMKAARDSLQATLDNVATILGADPTCNPDVEGWARVVVGNRDMWTKCAKRAFSARRAPASRV